MSIKNRGTDSLTVEIACNRGLVWRALAGELDQRGGHVEVLQQQAPERLDLLLRLGAGELQRLEYRLAEISAGTTLVTAAVSTTGPRHLLKRLLSFGRIDSGYLDAVAVGLANLQAQLEEGDQPEAELDEPEDGLDER